MSETLQVSILFLACDLFIIICCIIVMIEYRRFFRDGKKTRKKFLIDEKYKKYIYGYQPIAPSEEIKNKTERPKPPKGGNIAQNK